MVAIHVAYSQLPQGLIGGHAGESGEVAPAGTTALSTCNSPRSTLVRTMNIDDITEHCASCTAVGQPARCDAIFDRVFAPGVAESDGCATVLAALKMQRGNEVCADCHAPRPEYASINIGVFLCSWCFGVHREMGTHISRTKSIRLDTWRKDWLVNLVRVGNARAAVVWVGDAAAASAARPPIHSSTNEESLRVRKPFIRAKYVKQTFLRLPQSPRVSDKLGAGGQDVHMPFRSSNTVSVPVPELQATTSLATRGVRSERHGETSHSSTAASTLSSEFTWESTIPRVQVLSDGLGAVVIGAASAPAPLANPLSISSSLPSSVSLIDAGVPSGRSSDDWLAQFDPLA